MASKIQRELSFLLTGKDVSASKAMRGVRKEVNQLGSIGAKAGTNLSRNLQRTVVAGGAAAVGALGYAIKTAMDFESATAGVAKTVDGDISAIVAGLKNLSSTAPIAYEELAAIAEAGGALGIAKGDILSFTDVVAKLSVTTDLTSDAAATALGHLRTTIGLTGTDFGHFGNTLVDLGNNGASTESQILGMAESIAGAAGIVNLSKPQLLGWASALANTGEEVEAGGSSLQRFFLETFGMVNKGGADLKLLAKTAGMSAADFKKAYGKDASGALERFLVQLGKMDTATQAATLEALGFKDIRITRALLKLLANTDNLTGSLDQADKAWAENNAMTKEAEKRFATSASQMKILENNVRLAAATIGAELLPQINELAKEGVDWIQDHQPEIRQFAKDLAVGIRDAVNYARSLDWDAIAKGLQGAAGAAKGILDAFMALPDWVKQALVGGFVLNKATGGLVTDLAKFFTGLAVQRMIVNAAVVQVNGAGGGLGSAGGKTGGLRGLLSGALQLIPALFVAGIASEIEDDVQAFAEEIHDALQLPDIDPSQWDWPFGPKNTPKVDIGPIEDILGGSGGTKSRGTLQDRRLAPSSTEGGYGPGGVPGPGKISNEITGAVAGTLVGPLRRLSDAEVRADAAELSALRAGLAANAAATRAGIAGIRIPAPIVNVRVPVYIRPGVTSRTVVQANWESDRYASVTTAGGMKAI